MGDWTIKNRRDKKAAGLSNCSDRLAVFREYFIPFLRQIQFSHIQASLPAALKYAVLSTASSHALEASSPGTSTAR